MEQINIFSALDHNFLEPFGVMLISLLTNYHSNQPIHFYILHNGLNKKEKRKLYKIAKDYDVDITFISPNRKLFEGFKVTSRISEVAYYRIMISEFNLDIDKAIYLDSDLIVNSDITDLWNINITNHYLAAVRDPVGEKRMNDLSIPKRYGYFNSGVLLLNLKKWRQHDITTKVVNFIKENPNKICYWDQDALNAVLFENWLDLDPVWNVQTSFYINKKLITFSDELYRIAITNPAIIHYTGKYKPWKNEHHHPLKDVYFKYLNLLKIKGEMI